MEGGILHSEKLNSLCFMHFGFLFEIHLVERLDLFRLCPQYVAEHVPLHSKSPCKIMTYASGVQIICIH